MSKFKDTFKETLSYVGSHKRVERAKGLASNYDCITGCHQQATDWAYLGNAPDEMTSDYYQTKGSKHSGLPEFYAPMARACHRKLDAMMKTDPDVIVCYQDDEGSLFDPKRTGNPITSRNAKAAHQGTQG